MSKNETSTSFIIVDDGKYLIISNDEMLQNVDFDAFNKEHVSDNVKYKTKEKYSTEVTDSVVIVIERPFIDTREDPAHISINKCLSQLRWFIEEHHADNKYNGWLIKNCTVSIS